MLASTPAALQAILWPLAGAAILAILGRLLPHWLGRLVALAASIASLVALWSLRDQAGTWLPLEWEPFTFLRMGPALYPTPLALLLAITAAVFSASVVIGVRGSQRDRTAWRELTLVALAGCVLLAMAANGVTLALGSALIDLAWIGMAVSAVGGAGPGQRVTWKMCVPGTASTLLLFVAALQMDTQAGTASLLAADLPPQALALLGISGLLRLCCIFPLLPRGPSTPEQAASCLLPFGAGIYLLALPQTLASGPTEQPWFSLIAALAMLAGGWMAWANAVRRARSEPGAEWPGLAFHQAGFALAFVVLFPESAPWPLVSLTMALGALIIWWDGQLEWQTSPRPEWLEPLQRPLQPLRERLRSEVQRRAPRWESWRASWLARHGTAILPAVALASLAGVPLTLGALARWRLYGMALAQGRGVLLPAAFVADALLAGGVWATLKAVFTQASKRRPPFASLLAMAALILPLIVFGIAPQSLTARLGLQTAGASGVSPWGLGLLFVLPWLLGAWLARVSGAAGGLLDRLRRTASLERFYRGLGWAVQRMVDGLFWLGSVGEGEGWWGWALIILALGALFWSAR